MALRDYRYKLKAALESEMVADGPSPEDGFHEEADMTTALAEQAEGTASEINELATAAESLESLLATIRSSNEAFSPRELALIQHGVIGYTRPLGGEVASMLLPSNESNTAERAVASLESRVGEMLKQAWEWIKAQAAKLKKLFLDLFARIKKAFSSLRPKAKALKKKIEALSYDAKPQVAEIELPESVIRAAMFNGTLPNSGQFGAELTKLSADLGDITEKGKELLHRAVEGIQEFFTLKDEGVDAWVEKMESLEREGGKMVEHMTGYERKGSEYHSKFSISGKRIILDVDSLSVRFEDVEGIALPKKVKVLSRDELLKASEEIEKSIEECETLVSYHEKATGKEKLDFIMAQRDDLSPESISKLRKAFSWWLRTESFQNKAVVSCTRLLMDLCRAHLKIIDAMIKHYDSSAYRKAA